MSLDAKHAGKQVVELIDWIRVLQVEQDKRSSGLFKELLDTSLGLVKVSISNLVQGVFEGLIRGPSVLVSSISRDFGSSMNSIA